MVIYDLNGGSKKLGARIGSGSPWEEINVLIWAFWAKKFGWGGKKYLGPYLF